MKRKRFIFIIFFLVILLVLVLVFVFSKKYNKQVDYIHNNGTTQGTTYSVIYLQPNGLDLKLKIESKLKEFNSCLSSYDSLSMISRINNNDSSVITNECFEHMYNVAGEVYSVTGGAFDITVGPLIKAWGFGFGNYNHVSEIPLQKLLPLVGFRKIQLINHRIKKRSPQILIDANALAQGQSADIIAALLETNGCQNYMIEIGGEVVCKGKNPNGKKWRIGIDKPIDDPNSMNHELQAVVNISDLAITTSGNYRKFYYLNGKKYSHTIDPRTGNPVQHNILSATVIAPTCIRADAYATAFMVLGVDSSITICKQIQGMDCYLIYSDEKGNTQVVYTDGFRKYLSE